MIKENKPRNTGIQKLIVRFENKKDKVSGIFDRTLKGVPFTEVTPNITCNCFAKIPIPIAANIPWRDEEGKNSLNAPSLKTPNKNIKIPEKTIAAIVNR